MTALRARSIFACAAVAAMLTACDSVYVGSHPAPVTAAPGTTPTPAGSVSPRASSAASASPSPAASAVPTATAAPTSASTNPPIVDASLCTGWTSRTLASGLGILESVLPDPNGNGILVSSTSGNAVLRIDGSGNSTTLASVSAPGELLSRGGLVFVSTGDSTVSALAGTADGTFVSIDPKTGTVTTLSQGLTAPNGVGLDNAGNAYTSDTGTSPGTGITLIPGGIGTPVPNWAPVTDSNGIAIDPARRLMYVSQTFSTSNDVDVLSLDSPQNVTQLVSLTGIGSPVPKGLDDMIIDSAGIIDITANASDEVLRIDPQTKFACQLAFGFLNASSVAEEPQSPHALLVVGFDGTLHELTPPTPLP